MDEPAACYIIRSFIDYADASITRKLETLLSGGYIIQEINETLTYDYLHSSEENLWSVLYLTGYPTSLKDDTLSLSAHLISSWDLSTLPDNFIS